MTQTPYVTAVQDQITYHKAKEEGLLRAIHLLGRCPGNREAADLYLRASREYEENK